MRRRNKENEGKQSKIKASSGFEKWISVYDKPKEVGVRNNTGKGRPIDKKELTVNKNIAKMGDIYGMSAEEKQYTSQPLSSIQPLMRVPKPLMSHGGTSNSNSNPMNKNIFIHKNPLYMNGRKMKTRDNLPRHEVEVNTENENV